MYLPKLREIKEALTSFFTPPYTSKFPKAGYEAPKEFRGKPKFNKDFCVGCGTCAQVCPTQAIEIIDDKSTKTRTLRLDYGSCMYCGQCEEKCITKKGITLSSEYSLSVMDKNADEMFESIDRELVMCDICGEAFATREHLNWIKDKISYKAYAHPNLFIETQRQIFDSIPKSSVKDRIRREDQIKEVCPKCRHKIVVADEF